MFYTVSCVNLTRFTVDVTRVGAHFMPSKSPTGWKTWTTAAALRTNASTDRVDRNWTESGGKAP